MKFDIEKSVNQVVHLKQSDFSLHIKREDLIHPDISGNKYRKLKYNLLEAQNQGLKTLVTFGGAFSNHIAAVAAAGQEFGFKTIGVIRGEEVVDKVHDNPTLRFAKQQGMRFKFVSRADYRLKTTQAFIDALHNEFGQFYLVPEGGTNALAVKGCEEILTDTDADFDFVCCAIGTGGTISGLINSSKPNQRVLGFPALKGDFLNDEIAKFATKDNWRLISAYHFGGYAKINDDLISFINAFKQKTNIPLDPIYTGKMLFGIFDLLDQGFFPKESKILAIHTGGLQGIHGMNARLKQKQLPTIDI